MYDTAAAAVLPRVRGQIDHLEFILDTHVRVCIPSYVSIYQVLVEQAGKRHLQDTKNANSCSKNGKHKKY